MHDTEYKATDYAIAKLKELIRKLESGEYLINATDPAPFVCKENVTAISSNVLNSTKGPVQIDVDITLTMFDNRPLATENKSE